MCGKKAAAAHFHPGSLQVPSLVSDARPHSIRVALPSDKKHAEPVVQLAYIVAQQYGCGVIITDQYVESAVVVKVPDGKAASREALTEHRPTLRTDILECLALVME